MNDRIKRVTAAFSAAVATIENDSQISMAGRPAGRIDGHLVGILIVSAVVLSFLEYYGASNHWQALSKPLGLFVDDPNAILNPIFRQGEYSRLARLAYWSATTFVGYLIVPVLYIKLVMRRSLLDFGFSLAGAFKHWWIYVGLYLLVMPAVYIVSHTESFQRTYPFYEFAQRSPFDFFAWQLVYAAQFLALEFFYRGFLIHGLKHRFGVYAILVSTIPYCMIHFGKPLPETLGAIIAGVALGGLALYTRTIWLGVAIHISVAVSMDALSLLNQGKI
ncbi:MAG: CPBP family intramembrane metalloprotease [Bradymonadaceae bacterium]|nr:CPBP family intramembrane metalloprotease [Lujinxingiaceae bacterium]